MLIDIEATLEAQQALVDGLIEPIQINADLAIMVNEEGRLRGLPLNCQIGPHVIVGDFYIGRWDAEGEIQSLTMADILTCVRTLRGEVA
jgi:hypothetical protein